MTALLAFDTSTDRMFVGLQLAERRWQHEAAGGAAASAQLLPAIAAVLRSAEIEPAQLDAVAFGRGPGAFTGLRAACSVAQGLALGASIPVLPIDTLMAVAENVRQLSESIEVWVAIDARMGQIYAARYRYADRRWAVVDPPALTSPELLNSAWRAAPPRHLAGSALAAFTDRLHTGPAQCHAGAAPRAAALLNLASCAWVQGMAVDAASALPLYLRDKVAQTTDERAAARRLAAGAS